MTESEVRVPSPLLTSYLHQDLIRLLYPGDQSCGSDIIFWDQNPALSLANVGSRSALDFDPACFSKSMLHRCPTLPLEEVLYPL